MSDTPDTADTGAAQLLGTLDYTTTADSLRTVAGAQQLIQEAIENGLAAGDPTQIGDRGVAFLKPEGYEVEVIDVARFEDETRLPKHRALSSKFVGVDSLARYVDRYKTDATIAYIRDAYGRGKALLTSDSDIATVILDDHPADAVARRAHTAVLALRPTAAAQRWGAVLDKPIDQEQFLELVDDGMGEIGTPDGAVLRDLIADLHAIRNSEVKSVVRTGGQGAITLNENVQLHAGAGTTVPFPERMTIVLQPFAAVPSRVTLDLRVAPKVSAHGVTFKLSCSTLDDKLAGVLGDIAADLVERTGLNPHWQP